MRKIINVFFVIIFFSVLIMANPVANISRSEAYNDLKKTVEQNHPSDYSTQKYVLNNNMKDYDKLIKIESNKVNNEILNNLIKSFYPDFSTILYIYKDNINDYNELNTNANSNTNPNEITIEENVTPLPTPTAKVKNTEPIISLLPHKEGYSIIVYSDGWQCYYKNGKNVEGSCVHPTKGKEKINKVINNVNEKEKVIELMDKCEDKLEKILSFVYSFYN